MTPASTTPASSPAHESTSVDENPQWTHSWNDGQNSGTSTLSGRRNCGTYIPQLVIPSGVTFTNTYDSSHGSSRPSSITHNTNIGPGPRPPSSSSSSTTYQDQTLNSLSLPSGAVIKNCRVNSRSGSNIAMMDCQINSSTISNSLVNDCRFNSSTVLGCQANDCSFNSCSVTGGARKDCRYNSCSVVG